MKSQFIITLLTLLSLSASAQTDSLFQYVAKRLYDYYSYAPVEKVYLHQDRTTYLPGETVWFKIYQSSTENRINSGVVYVELNNGNNETVIKTKWELKDGSGSGHIELPNTLPMGVYQLRAYTNWMMNNSPGPST
ncbi:MAG: hypothetical protein LBV32_06395 [Tannerellaceae bacterium]|jgi:uncharacterized protein YfaS (alpha-2-macroglobulin family)|nr:hypothetical protein [Tannerellaceae bacterium]